MFCLAASFASLRAGVLVLNSGRSPFCIVGETVRVSVARDLAMVEGEYDLKYVRRWDAADHAEDVPFTYAVFASKDADGLDAVDAVAQARLRIGSVDFEPDDCLFLPEYPAPAIHAAPEDARVAILTFRIPRRLLKQQCRVKITHYQPFYRFGGKTVVAFLPLLPDFEALKNELLFSKSDFSVAFEVVDAVRLGRLTPNASVEGSTAQKFTVHPSHRENIAAEVILPPQPAAKTRS